MICRNAAEEGVKIRGNMCIFEGKNKEIEGAHGESQKIVAIILALARLQSQSTCSKMLSEPTCL
jgi:hypothetical protein